MFRDDREVAGLEALDASNTRIRYTNGGFTCVPVPLDTVRRKLRARREALRVETDDAEDTRAKLAEIAMAAGLRQAPIFRDRDGNFYRARADVDPADWVQVEITNAAPRLRAEVNP